MFGTNKNDTDIAVIGAVGTIAVMAIACVTDYLVSRNNLAAAKAAAKAAQKKEIPAK